MTRALLLLRLYDVYFSLRLKIRFTLEAASTSRRRVCSICMPGEVAKWLNIPESFP